MSQYGGVEQLLLCSVAVAVFTFDDGTAELEDIWKKKWFGYLLIAVFLAGCVWLNFHIPPSGYGVVAMAVVAGIIAIRPEMGGWERSLWFVLLLLFGGLEIRAIKN